MELSCPSCQQPLEVDLDATTDAGPFLGNTLAEVDCPNCGSVPLPQDGDATVSYMQEHASSETQQVGHFKLIRMLGAGAFGAVWLADDETLGRKVALKLQLSPEQDVDSLLHEAHTAAGLEHPNIVSIYEVGRDDGRVFVASQYLDGLTLQNLLSQGKPPIKRACELAATVARALHYAHGKGVIHRDIKPANIILDTDGQPCVADFGLAKRLSTTQTISFEGQVLGTARYMSPEQAAGKTQATDHRSDLYSLGVCLFQMLTGHLPFRGNVQAVLHQKMFEDAPSPRTLAPTLPRDLETICLKCLERDPARRYQTTEELAEELDRYLNGEPIKARPISSVERAWRWCQRRPTISGLATGLFLSLSIGLLSVSYYWRQAERSDAFTRQALYRSQMNLAAEYLDRSDIDALRQTLGRFSTDERLADLRGFEWRYFDGAASAFVRIISQGVPVTDVAASADGTLLASLATDRSLRVWDADSGELLRAIELPAGRFRTLVFLAGSNRLAAGATDGIVRIWNPLQSDRPVAQFKQGPQVQFLRASQDGTTLLTSGAAGAVRLWNAETQERLAEFPTGQGKTLDVRLATDGSVIAVAKDDGRIRIIDAASGSTTHVLGPVEDLEKIAFSPDSRRLAAGTYGGILTVWSIESGQQEMEHETRLAQIGALEFLDNSLLSMTGVYGGLLVLDVDTRIERCRMVTHELSTGRLSVVPSVERLVIGSGDGSVKILDTKQILAPHVFWHDAHVREVAFLPETDSILAADGTGSIRRWRLEDGSSEDVRVASSENADTESLRTAALHPNGSVIAVAGTGSDLQLIDTESGDVRHVIEVPDRQIVRLRFAPDGKLLIALSTEGGLSCFRISSDAEPQAVFDVQPFEDGLADAIFAADGNQLLVASQQGVLQYLDATSGESVGSPFAIRETPSVIQFCRQGQRIVVGTLGGKLLILDARTGQLRSTTKAHSGQINALAEFPDGRAFVSAGRDRALNLWETETGERLTTLYGHPRQVFSVAVSQDGQTVVSASLAGDVRVWRGGTK